MTSKVNPGMFSSDRPDWETPPELFALYDAEYHFTLDVCATAENAKCDKFFTPEIDGLSQSWSCESCWCNPPYGREVGEWVKKAAEESTSAKLIVLLLPARTDTAWWHNYVAPFSSVDFLRGRVCFVGGDSSAPFPSAVAIYDHKFNIRWRDWKNERVK